MDTWSEREKNKTELNENPERSKGILKVVEHKITQNAGSFTQQHTRNGSEKNTHARTQVKLINY